MNESAHDTAARDKGPRFSLRQIIAVITSVAATFAVCAILASPPLHSIGLREAALPALVLVTCILLIPFAWLAWLSLFDAAGNLTTQNYARLLRPAYVGSFLTTFR